MYGAASSPDRCASKVLGMSLGSSVERLPVGATTTAPRSQSWAIFARISGSSGIASDMLTIRMPKVGTAAITASRPWRRFSTVIGDSVLSGAVEPSALS